MRTSDRVILEADDITVGFRTDAGLLYAASGVSYEVHEREVLAIVGESGSGKSVSSMALLGLLPPNARVSGQAHLGDLDLLALSPREHREIRGNRLSMVFQDPTTALNPVHRIGDQLAEALSTHRPIGRSTARELAADTLGLVGIPDPRRRLQSYPHELSGGMRQRVMIAMAVLNAPDLIIADEPTTALDVTVQAQVLDLLLSVVDAVGAALILVTHDLAVVSTVADRVLVMYGGRPVETGTTQQVLEHPTMPYTAGLLASLPRTDARRLSSIGGSPPSLVDVSVGCAFAPRCPLAEDRCHRERPALRPSGQLGATVACHRSEDVVAMDDPLTIFTQAGET